MTDTYERRMYEAHDLIPSQTQPCLWDVLGQSCGGEMCVLCAALDDLAPLRMWTDADGHHVLTADFQSGDLVGMLWNLVQLERTVPDLRVQATDWGKGTLLMFWRRRDLAA